MAKVLAVDDEDDILHIIRVNLEREGHEVITARDGDEAIERVRREQPDIVVLDIRMPGTDGWGVLSRIKSEANVDVSTIPVIMLTGHAMDAESRIRGGIEGAIRYLLKPFVPSALCDEVKSALEGEPEPMKRRRVQRESLEELARLEKGTVRSDGDVDARPHLTRMERPHEKAGDTAAQRELREKLDQLSPKQVRLLEALRVNPSVSQVATDLSVSRSNIYAGLRRISRRLGTRSVSELLALVRSGELFPPA